jgi:hypothetical protein
MEEFNWLINNQLKTMDKPYFYNPKSKDARYREATPCPEEENEQSPFMNNPT